MMSIRERFKLTSNWQFPRWFYLALALLYVFAWQLHASMFGEQDVLAFMDWATRLLRGGSYQESFFETNPPLIIYISIVPVYLSKWLSLSWESAYRLCGFILATFALMLSASLFALYLPGRRVYLQCLLVVLTLCWLILPTRVFFQRESIMLMMVMPYLITVVLRRQHKSIPIKLAVTSGVMAIAFALKPFFMLVPAFLEIYLLYCRRQWRNVVRPELLVMMAMMMVYAVWVVWYHADYFTAVMPFMLRYYYTGLSSPVTSLLFSQFGLSCLIAYGLCQMLKKTAMAEFYSVMLLAMLGFFIAYVMGGITLYYHAYPAYALSFIIFNMAMCEYIILADIERHDILVVLALLSMQLIVVINTARHHVVAGAPSLMTYVATYLVLAMALVYGYRRWVGARPRMLSMIIYTSLVVISVSLPVMMLLITNAILGNTRSYVARFEQYLRQHVVSDSLYFINTNNFLVRSSAYHSGKQLTMRYPFLWMLPGMLVREGDMALSVRDRQQLANDKTAVARMIYSDIMQTRPGYLFVDIGANNISAGATSYGFDLERYFQSEPYYQQALSNYVYEGDINLGRLINYKVYRYREKA